MKVKNHEWTLRRVMKAGGVLLISLILCTASTQASESLHIETVARSAQRIVVATVLHSEVRPGPGGNLFTFTDFRIDESVKGDLSGTFRTRVIGGKLGDIEITSAFERPFIPGRRYVLFLGITNRDGFVTVIPSLLFEVTESSGSRGALVEGPVGLPIFESATGKAYSSLPTIVPLADFIYSLRRVNIPSNGSAQEEN